MSASIQSSSQAGFVHLVGAAGDFFGKDAQGAGFAQRAFQPRNDAALFGQRTGGVRLNGAGAPRCVGDAAHHPDRGLGANDDSPPKHCRCPPGF